MNEAIKEPGEAGRELTDGLEQELKRAINVLRECAQRGAEINPPMCQWFDGYQKACVNIEEMVIDAAFTGKPLPVRWQPRNEAPG